MKPRQIPLKDDPQWYKDAVVYQLHVKTFHDSDGNGIGDFQGLLKKLDYLQDLGVTAIWLLPFYPSPLRDDGYDIADYFDVHADYGSLKDFQEFLKSAHYRGMRVITELVINHTSDQHRWFQLARRSKPGSEMREYYVWSDTTYKYADARIIFKDFESSNWSWDPVAGAYYWHRFYSHQPDLNFDNPRVQKAIFKILDFWFGMGVDGLRLDAVPYLFEREGTNCENLPETHAFLKKLRAYVDAHYSNRLLLAEANQWPEDAVTYFGEGDECHMAFHFPIMPRLFMALWMEDRFPLLDILDQTPPIPEGAQWAMFLRNHDELTLEMVTDEERDYMYRIYAKDPRARINLGIRRRLAPLLNNNRRKIELMNFLLFSLPGTPIVYYGDEIGMGDNYFLGDRNGVRTPMQWSPDRNAGFSFTNPQHLYLPVIMDPEYHFEVVNVENQDKNVSSLLWWMRRVIAMRRKFNAFGRGRIRFLLPDNPKVLAFLREYEDEVVLVVINLSRFAQVAELDLSEFATRVPVEVFSGNRFPRIEEHPYLFTLGIHDYFWFSLHKEEEFVHPAEMGLPKEILLQGSWEDALQGAEAEKLERILPAYITLRRWFRAKARIVRNVRIRDDIPLGRNRDHPHLLLLEVFYTEGASELYILPVTFVPEDEARAVQEQQPQAVISRVRSDQERGILMESVFSEPFRGLVLDMIVRNRRFQGIDGDMAGWHGKRLERLRKKQAPSELPSQVLKAEQSNTSLLYGGTYFLKLYRKVEEGVNPDAEIVAYLTEKQEFSHVPPFLGQIEYRRAGSESLTLGMLQQFVPNQGDAWNFAQDNLEHYFEHILARKSEFAEVPELSAPSLFSVDYAHIPQVITDCIGGYFLEAMGQLGRITAEMHLALGRELENPAFVPEPFSKLYQRSVYQAMRNLTRRTMEGLRRNITRLPESVREEAESILHREQPVLDIMARITEHKIEAMKIRIHGDYHLGQVLRSGNSFLIIDFEGEPARPLSERRLKRSCFKDVAGMIRSFHYAAHSALFSQASIRAGDMDYLRAWARPWFQAVSGLFLRSYMLAMDDSPLVPGNRRDLEVMFDIFLLEKAVYELGYELNNRPDWISIPIRGIRQILDRTA
jgi:maltose alpha-D-glucosyltransferase/alpha-amylase